MGAPRPEHDADVLVIGSGFGGSVAALRPSEKGYRVTVLEAGLRFTDDTLPRTSWDVRRFLWAPRLGLKGIQRISKVGKVVVFAGAVLPGPAVFAHHRLTGRAGAPVRPGQPDARRRADTRRSPPTTR